MAESFPGTERQIELAAKKLYCEFSIGASGAATLVRGKGITSVAKSTTGVYVITLARKYVRLIGLTAQAKNTSTVPNAPFVFESAADTVSTSQTITLTTCAASGTSGALVATEPASGNVYRLKITLKMTAMDG